jgi:protein-tyrosine phosphatase
MTTLEQEYERRLVLEGAMNFRDLGGYPTQDGRRVRWRRLFRSARLVDLTPTDIDVLRRLGIATVFDLRTADELERHGTSPLYDHGVIHRHVPFVQEVGNTGAAEAASEQSVEERRPNLYIDLIERAQPAIGEVFTALAEPHHYPAVFHCAAGKDRTGMTAALLLHALGVDDEVIAEDYALTAQYLHYTDEQLEQMAKEYNITVTREQLGADPETILTLLRTLDQRYGSVLAFLARCGVTYTMLGALQEQLLEE